MGRVAKQYRVVFLGIMNDDETFRNNMAGLGVSYTDLNKCIENAPVVLKRDLRLADARIYADVMINAGGSVNIQETGEFPEARSSTERRIASRGQDFVLCPNCGFKQKKEDSCVRCGFDLTSSL